MKQLGRRTIGLFLAVVMLLSLVPVAFADNTANFPDFPTGWSKEAMTAAVKNGLLNGYDDGNIHPEANLTRAQFAAILTRAFGAQTKADVSGYSDVYEDAWYYDAIAKAVKMGALNGKSSTQMDPDASITRQEVFTAIARVLVLSNSDTSALDKFNDKGEIASWAINHMAALTQREYVNGDPQGNVNPTAWISREEFAQVMHNAIRTYITEPGTYTKDLDGITVVRVGDVTLKGLKNTSDLVIGDGAGVGNINIESVTIEKRLLARGGTIKVSKSTRGDFVVVNNMNGITSFNNYRDEAFFKDIVENTQAKFLERAPGGTGGGTGGGGGGTGGDTVYTLTLKVDGVPYDTVTVTNGTPNKTVIDPTKDYYTFDGWYDAGNHKITNFATVTATQELNAKFIANTYNVTYAGTPTFAWKDEYAPITSFTVEEFGTKQLPPADKVDAALGYQFEYWKVNGNRVDSLQAIKDGGYLPTTPANITIEAQFSLKTYRIEYQNVTFVNDYTAPTEYNIDNVSTIQLPPADKVVAPAGQEFRCWKTQATNVQVDSLSVTADTPDTLVLVPHFVPVGSSDVVYTLTLKVDGEYYDTIVVTNGVLDKPVTDPTKDYYTFDGWYDSENNKVTDFSTVTATQELNAKFEAIVYSVSYGAGGSFAPVEFIQGYTAPTSFTVETGIELPSADKVVLEYYQVFYVWAYKSQQVEDLDDILALGINKTATENIRIQLVNDLKRYRIEYQNATFVDGYTAPTGYTINNAASTQLPPADKVVAPAGQEFKYWKVQATGTRIDSLTVTVMTPDVLVLVPHFVPVGSGDTVYTLTLKKDGEVYDTVIVTNGIPNKTVTDPAKDYYTFDGWYDAADNKITNFGTVTATQELNAKFNAISYAVTFTGDPAFTWKDEYSPITSFTVDELSTKELPPADKVAAPTGYIFEYWKIDANRVDSLAEIKDGGYLPTNTTASLTIEAHYSLKEYRVAYTGVTWQDGHEPTNLTYNILNADSYVLPTKDDVVAPDGEELKYWKDAITGVAVDILTIDADTPDVFTLTPHFGPIPTEPVTVTFYNRYSTVRKIREVPIDKGTTVDKSSFPNAENYARKTGYKENATIASLYAGNEYEHTIVPEFWYVKDGKITPFDETVVVTEDTNVYLLSKSLSLMLSYEYNGKEQELGVFADYNKDTRVMETIKDIVAISAKQQLELALEQDMIPNYDEMVAKAVDAMVKAGVIELDGDKKNVQIVDVPFKISTFVKEDTANNMIKKHLREIVKNPDELDKIFSMIDVAEFAEQLGIDTIIEQMTDDEIASLIKSEDNKGDIVDYVFTDLKKDESTMLDFVVDYLIADAEFRADLIDQIIADLKDKNKTSTLKTKALDYIMTQIADDKSLFYGKFVDMIVTDLKSENSVVMDEVVKYIRTNLKATTQEGKDLRKEILTSSLLPEFLSDPKMKAEVIKIALTDAFIEKALNNAGYREILVEAAMKDTDFVELLINSNEFHDYVIDQLHPVEGDATAHPLAKDVEDLINNTNSEFRKHVLNLVKDSDTFVKLFESHPELIDVVSDEIKWSDFVADEDDLLRYVLQQDNVTGTYTFISIDEIEQAIADEYNERAESDATGKYETLTDDQKQEIRDEIYRDQSRRQSVLESIKAEFESYKADMVDKITKGKADEITDTTVIELVDELLADYVTKYIEKETLNADPAINASITKVIEDILFDFIGDLILGVDLGNPALDAELDAMLGHIDSVKHQFVVDASPEAIAKLKEIVEDYRDTHPDNINKIVSDNYTKLTDKILGMLNPEDPNSVYGDVESTLITVADTIDAGAIKNYITKIDDGDLKDLIKKYMKNVTVTDLNNYIASFLTVAENENAVRTELNAFVQDTNQKDTVKGFAKTYINDPLNESEIKENISKFIDDIDEDFVNENRSVITEALKSVDISEFVDEEFIKDYVEGLDESKGEKTKFADDIFAALQKDADYTKFMRQLLNGETVEVNKSNVSLVTAISGAIRGLTFDSVIDYIDNAAINKLKDVVGTDFIKKYYDSMMADYCDGLDAVIDEVKAASDNNIKKTYKTSLTLRVNIFEIYEKLYDKAADKAFDKLENAGIYYNENKYLNFLIEQDFLSYLFDGDKSLANGDFTGYSLKGVMDYYDYLTMLLIVGDDALTWYGDDEGEGLTEAQLEALYDAMFEKIFTAHEKMNEILITFKDEGKLPSKVQSAIESVERLNSLVLQYGDKAKSLIKKYLGSSINAKFEDESIADSEKVIKMLDVLIGNEDPVLTIDTIYAVIYEYDDAVQEKLKQVIESDKFKQAVDKFEATSFGELFDGKGKLGTVGDKLDELKNNGKIESALDSVYDLFYILAYEGIDAFKVPADEMEVTDIDIYKVKIAKVEMTVQRAYR